MVSSSSRKTKKFSEFGVGGKYTSDDGESSSAASFTEFGTTKITADDSVKDASTEHHYEPVRARSLAPRTRGRRQEPAE